MDRDARGRRTSPSSWPFSSLFSLHPRELLGSREGAADGSALEDDSNSYSDSTPRPLRPRASGTRVEDVFWPWALVPQGEERQEQDYSYQRNLQFRWASLDVWPSHRTLLRCCDVPVSDEPARIDEVRSAVGSYALSLGSLPCRANLSTTMNLNSCIRANLRRREMRPTFDIDVATRGRLPSKPRIWCTSSIWQTSSQQQQEEEDDDDDEDQDQEQELCSTLEASSLRVPMLMPFHNFSSTFLSLGGMSSRLHKRPRTAGYLESVMNGLVLTVEGVHVCMCSRAEKQMQSWELSDDGFLTSSSGLVLSVFDDESCENRFLEMHTKMEGSTQNWQRWKLSSNGELVSAVAMPGGQTPLVLTLLIGNKGQHYVAVCERNGSSSQRWTFVRSGSSTQVHLSGDMTGMGAGESPEEEEKSMLVTASVRKGFKTNVTVTMEGYLQSKLSGLVLTVKGSNVRMYKKTGETTQLWKLTSEGYLVSGDFILTACKGDLDDYFRLEMHAHQVDKQRQKWEWKGDRDGYLELRSGSNGETYALDICMQSTDEGASLHVCRKKPIEAQKWLFTEFIGRSVDNPPTEKDMLEEENRALEEDICNWKLAYSQKEKELDDLRKALPFERLIACKQWDTVISKVDENPNEVPVDILHLACKYGPPLSVISSILMAREDLIEHTNRERAIPLHIVCFYGAELSVVADLVERYPGSEKIENFQRKTPLDMAQTHAWTYCKDDQSQVIDYLRRKAFPTDYDGVERTGLPNYDAFKRWAHLLPPRGRGRTCAAPVATLAIVIFIDISAFKSVNSFDESLKTGNEVIKEYAERIGNHCRAVESEFKKQKQTVVVDVFRMNSLAGDEFAVVGKIASDERDLSIESVWNDKFRGLTSNLSNLEANGPDGEFFTFARVGCSAKQVVNKNEMDDLLNEAKTLQEEVKACIKLKRGDCIPLCEVKSQGGANVKLCTLLQKLSASPLKSQPVVRNGYVAPLHIEQCIGKKHFANVLNI